MVFVHGAPDTVLVPVTVNAPVDVGGKLPLANPFSDGFLLSLDTTQHGVPAATRLLGSTGPARANAVVGDTQATVWAGQFLNAISSTTATSSTPAGFLASMIGAQFDAHAMTVTACGHSTVQALSADPAKSLMTGGLIGAGTFSEGGIIGTKSLPSPTVPGAENVFVARSGGNGWANGLLATAAPNSIEVASVVVDNGQVYVAGTFSGELRCSSKPAKIVAAGTATAGFVAQFFVGDGTCKNLVRIGGNMPSAIHGMKLNPYNSSLVLVGDFQGNFVVNMLPLNADLTDGFVVGLDANLTPAWAHQIGGGGNESARDLTFALSHVGAKHLYVVGDFDGNLNIGPIYPSSGGADAYVADIDVSNATDLATNGAFQLSELPRL
jgi:hypothetical protein